MSYAFEREESVRDGLRRIAGREIERALQEAEDPGSDPHHAVHEVRKRCKRLRALLRLARPALGETYRRENARFRELSRDLSHLRDAAARVEALDRLHERFAAEVGREPFELLRRRLLERRDELDGRESRERLACFAAGLRAARADVERWELSAHGFEALAGGLARTHGHAREAMRQAYRTPDTAHFHAWRKRAKDAFYQLTLLTPVWPRAMEPLVDAADELAHLLGEEHDLAVVDAALAEEADAFAEPAPRETLARLVRAHAHALRRAARPLGRRLFAERPKALARRLGAWWDAWREDGPEGSTG